MYTNYYLKVLKGKLTLCVPIEFSIKFDTVQSGWSIAYIEGSEVILSKIYYISFSEDLLLLANSADTDEMPQAFHLGLHCCQSTHLGVSGTQKFDQKIQKVKLVQEQGYGTLL